MEAKTKANAAKIAEGTDAPELSDFEIKKDEKEKQVIEYREKLKDLKEKVKPFAYYHPGSDLTT